MAKYPSKSFFSPPYWDKIVEAFTLLNANNFSTEKLTENFIWSGIPVGKFFPILTKKQPFPYFQYHPFSAAKVHELKSDSSTSFFGKSISIYTASSSSDPNSYFGFLSLRLLYSLLK